MELARYSKSFLPILFNLCTTVPAGAEEAGRRLASLETIKPYFMIPDIELVNPMFDRLLDKFRINGLSAAGGRDSAGKHVFQAEVNRMTKLINNSLYRNEEVYLRELTSNVSVALDKISLISLTYLPWLSPRSSL